MKNIYPRMLTYLIFMLTLTTGLMAANVTPVGAGEPDGTIGPMNPTMFRCVEDESDDEIEIFQPDPFSKQFFFIIREGGPGGDEVEIEMIQDILDDFPEAREKTCTNDIEVDFGFDPKDAQQFESYLKDLEDQCDDLDGHIEPITDTRVEGYVYEFHHDVNRPGAWFGVPSQDVPVVAKGITFEITWGTDNNGFFYFSNLGAGPVVLNLGPLPPDAHPLNSNVILYSTGLEEPPLSRVSLGFYRGDLAPTNITDLRTPTGGELSFGDLSEIENIIRCGYTDMPNVGGVLPPQEQSFSTVALVAVILVILPVAGILRLRRQRSEETGL